MSAAVERVSGEPRGPGEFRVQSATDPEHSWMVAWQSPHAHWCGCPAFQLGRPCRHVKAVFDAIKAEWEDARAAGAFRRPAKKETTTE